MNQKIFVDEKYRQHIVETMSMEQKYSLLRELVDNLGKGTFRWLIYNKLHYQDYFTADTDLKLMQLNNAFIKDETGKE